MPQIILSRIAWTLGLLLLQIWVLNHVSILGYATPMPYVLCLLLMPSTFPRWAWVVMGFAVGWVLDLFTFTPGMASASLCLVGLVAPVLQRLFTDPHSEEEVVLPSARTMRWSGFARYTLLATLLHCTCFHCLEAFTLFQPVDLCINIAGSTLLTWLIILGMELLRKS